MKRTLAIALAIASLAVSVGWAVTTVKAEDKLAVIMERRDLMKSQSKALQTARFYGEGRAEQDEAVKAITDLMKITASVPDQAKFPTGTSTTDFPGKSGAKPAIWTEWDKFKDAPKAALEQEQKLLDLIKAGDKEAVVKQSGATWNDGCQVCHIPYREKIG